MTEAEWLACEDPGTILEFFRDRTSDRKLRLIAVACCQRAKFIVPTDYHDLADIAEAFAEGRASAEDLEAVWARHCRLDSYPDRAAFYDTADPNICASEQLPYLVEDLADGIASCKVDHEGKTFEEWVEEKSAVFRVENSLTSVQIRDIFGNPFRPVPFSPSWRTSTVVALAAQMYESRDFSAMPILADALQDVGCDSADVLDHCRNDGPHVRGCWIVDLVLGKE
ncbi:Uncharacterized protein (Fragment) OS=uncultured bacterium PE=4 SV=1 [Gemmata massiliana]|uniref:SMI1/KNR4 family protein n=1 Tax=Gemmata massiliana TaxID=1210884 RepID=A0A6P2DAB2_9BACT